MRIPAPLTPEDQTALKALLASVEARIADLDKPEANGSSHASKPQAASALQQAVQEGDTLIKKVMAPMAKAYIAAIIDRLKPFCRHPQAPEAFAADCDAAKAIVFYSRPAFGHLQDIRRGAILLMERVRYLLAGDLADFPFPEAR